MGKARKQLKKGIVSYLGQGGFPRGISLEEMGFTGTLTPEIGATLQQGVNQAQAFTPYQPSAEQSGAMSRLLSGEQTFNADPALRERYFQQAVTDPAQQFFNTQVAPSIAARYGRGGNIGAASYATGQAGQQLAGQLAGTRAGLLRDDERLAEQSRQAAQARIAQGLGLGVQQGALGLQSQQFGQNNLMQFGQLERGIRGQGIQEQLQRVLARQAFNDPRLGLFQMLGQPPTPTGGHTSTNGEWYSGALAALTNPASLLGFG